MSDSNQQLVVQNKFALARQLDDNTFNAIKEIYDGASDEKVALVIDYCKARKLDPLKKPVHIVPVWSNRRKQMVETLWPSVSEVRITAMRTGLFAGQSATEFGPDITRKVGNVEMTFPEWAMVTVFRQCNGAPQPFPGPKCRWMETYANRGKDDASPNSMWLKRPYAQLEKCAEAAALRRAFPEEGNYTAEEMHGKSIDDDEPMNVTPAEQQQPAPVTRAEPKPRKAASTAKEAAKEVVVEQEPAKTEPAPVEVVAEPKNITPEHVQETPRTITENGKVVQTESPEAMRVRLGQPAPQSKGESRMSLNDGERITALVEVIAVDAVNAKIGDKVTPSVRAEVKGEYTGTIRHKGAGVMNGDKVVPGAPYANGAKLKLKLLGEKSASTSGPMAGKVIVWVEGAEAIQATEEF